MSNNLEQIKSKVFETRNQIEQSRDLSPEEKMAKAREFENVISEISRDLELLKPSATPQELKEIEAVEQEYKKLQEQLTVFKKELDDFQSSVVESVALNNDDSEIIPSENDKPSRWDRNKKTVLIWAGTLWVGLLIRKIWKDRKERKAAEANWTTPEKKPWYKKWRWMGLIWVWWFFGIKWLMDYFKKWEPMDDDKEKYDTYLDFMKENKEDYNQYEQLWSNVNEFYDKAWKSEKENFWFETNLEMWSIWNNIEKEQWYEHVETKGMVPFCLDNYYTNVDDMLSAGWVRSYLRNKTMEWYKQTIISFWADWFNKTLVPYLSMFTNFTSFGIISTDSADQKMNKFFKWIADESDDKKQQLDIFFRQYTKILTYMADKKNALAIKYATPIIQTQWYDWKTWPSDPDEQKEILLEAINNKEWVDKNLKWTHYGLFLDSKILWSSKILESEWLLNSDITFELQDIIDNLDQDAEDILWWLESNALFDAEATINNWWSIDQSTKTGLSDICDNLVEDMWDNTNWSWVYNTFEYLFDALDLSEEDKQKIIEESWMKEAFDWIKTNIQWLRAEIITNPTKENIAKLKNLTWEYLAMKKELHLAVYAMQEAKENKNFIDHVANVINWLWTFFKKFFESIWNIFSWNISLWSGINFFLGCAVTWTGLVILWRITKKPILTISWRVIQKVWLFPISLTKAGLRSLGYWWAVESRIKQLVKDWKPDKARRLLYRWISNWDLSLDQAVRAGKTDNLIPLLTKVNNSENFKVILSNMMAQDQVDLFAKYYSKNKKFASNLIKESSKIDIRLNVKQNIEIKADMFNELKKLDLNLEKISNISANNYFDNMFKKVRNADDLKLMNNLSNNNEFIKKISSDNLKKLNKLSLNEIRKLQSSWDFDSFVRWNKNLDDILSSLWKNKNIVRRTIEAATNIDAATKTKFNSIIDEAIISVRSQSSLNANFSKINEAKLSNLKNNKYLTELDMKSLVTLHWKWFRWSSLPDLFDVLKSDIPYNKWTGKLGQYLQDALKAWDYDSFIRALWDHKNLITKIDVDDIIKQMDNVKFALKNADEFVVILKSISRIIKFI